MQIIVSGKFSYDVADAQSYVLDLNKALKSIDFSDIETKINSIVYFPVILSDEFPVKKKSHRSFSKKEAAEFVNIEISHEEWVRANDLLRWRIIVSGLEKAILETSDARIDDVSKRAIIERMARSLNFHRDNT